MATNTVQFINNLSASVASQPAHMHSHEAGGPTHEHGGEHGHTHEHLDHPGTHAIGLVLYGTFDSYNLTCRKIRGTRPSRL